MTANVFERYFQACEEAGLLASLSFELTDACNFGCTHCYRVHGNTFLSREVFYKALGEAEEMGALMISFNGGEPTLHPDFGAFAQEVLRRGMHLSILTNAYRLTPQELESLAPWAQNVHFQISIYGVDDTSAQAIAGVENAYNWAFEHALWTKKLGFSVKIALLALHSTANRMSEVTARLQEAQLPYDIMLFVSGREDGSLAPHDLAPTNDDLRRLLPLKTEIFSPVDEQDPSLPMPQPSDNSLACSAGVAGLALRADGRILPCQVFYTWPVFGQEPQNSLQEAFDSPLRLKFLEENRVPKTCRTCEHKTFCLRCPADVFNISGQLEQVPKTSCRVARIWHEWEAKKSAPPS